MKLTYIEIEATAEDLKNNSSLSDCFRNLLIKTANRTEQYSDESDSEEVEE